MTDIPDADSLALQIKGPLKVAIEKAAEAQGQQPEAWIESVLRHAVSPRDLAEAQRDAEEARRKEQQAEIDKRYDEMMKTPIRPKTQT